MTRVTRNCLVLALVLLALAGCDRRIEPYVEGEEPKQPDLSRIFPPGAEQAGEGMPAQAAGMPAAPGAPSGRGAAPVAGNAEPIRGTVSVAPGLEDQAARGGVLFVIARPGAAGPPLAVKRFESPKLPLDFELGPGDRMIQAMPFQGPLQVTARLDADGNATTRTPGDLQGSASSPANPGDTGVSVVLDEVLSGAPAGRGAAPMAGGAEPFRGTVSVAPGLEDEAARGGVLFVIARRGAAGPPLAVKRIESPKLPLDFEIGPGDRMIQAMPFQGPLQVTARLDADGNATTHTPGDLQGAAASPVNPGDTGVSVVLDEVL